MEREYGAVILLLACIGTKAIAAEPAIKPIVDLRLRHEAVDQEPFARDASATTLRVRLGFETGKFHGASLLVEGASNLLLDDDYNSTVNGHSAWPVVADPENHALNRLQLQYTGIDATTVTLGRQRMNLDDQRFVGSVGWRQNEQTFDALRIVNKSLKTITLDLTYANQVNRIFGREGLPGVNAGTLHGDTVLANLGWQSKLGGLTAFGYVVDFDEPLPARDATQSYGLRFSGERQLTRLKLGYVLSVATQRAYGDNPLAFSNGYSLAEITASTPGYSLGAGIETLEGDGVKGFTTPLATLHRFQGWADKFLTTPVDGIRDAYVTAGWHRKGVGVLDSLALSGAWHQFDAQRRSIDYGNEIDLQLQARLKRVTVLLKYAVYSAGSTTPPTLRDTRKLWAQIEFAL